MSSYWFLLRTLPPAFAALFFVFFINLVIDYTAVKNWHGLGTGPYDVWFSGEKPPPPAVQPVALGGDAAVLPLSSGIRTSVAPFLAKETAARSLWAVNFAIAVIAAVAASLYCLTILWRQVHTIPGGGWLIPIILLMPVAGVLIERQLNWFGNPIFEALADPALRFVTASPLAALLGAGPTAYDATAALRPWYGVIVILTVVSIVVGAASLTTPVQQTGKTDPVVTAREIAVRMGLLNRLLYAASAALVLAVIAVRALVAWPAALAKGAFLADMTTMGQSALISWGASMSLLLLVTYGTAAFWLDREADGVLTARTEPERIKQRAEHGLTLDIRTQVGKVLVAALPLLTSSADALYSGLLQAVP